MPLNNVDELSLSVKEDVTNIKSTIEWVLNYVIFIKNEFYNYSLH